MIISSPQQTVENFLLVENLHYVEENVSRKIDVAQQKVLVSSVHPPRRVFHPRRAMAPLAIPPV